MAQKARRKSNTAAPVSPQLTFYFRQLREHGQSPAAALEYLTKADPSRRRLPQSETTARLAIGG